jgi:hypothetical protein
MNDHEVTPGSPQGDSAMPPVPDLEVCSHGSFDRRPEDHRMPRPANHHPASDRAEPTCLLLQRPPILTLPAIPGTW